MTEPVPLREYVDLRFAEFEKRMDERLRGQNTAIDLAAATVHTRLEGMNAFREQLDKERGDYVTRKEVLGLMLAAATITSAVVGAAVKVVG